MVLSFVQGIGMGALLLGAAMLLGAVDRATDHDEPMGPADCPAVGDICDDGTIYIGSRELKDASDVALGDFYLFAAPEDLKGKQRNRLLLTFSETVEHVEGLRDWYGYDGGNFANETAWQAAIRDGRYNGQWVIPPKDILVENLFENRDQGALRSTFETASRPDEAHWYRSSTAYRNSSSSVYVVDFTDGIGIVEGKDWGSLSSRLIRAEPRP